MAFFTNLFGGKKTLSHHAKTLVDFFRASAPTSLKKLSDKEILRISKEVMNSFKTVSEQRGEHIPGESLLTIATFFLVLYESSGRKLYVEHLKYELSRYTEYGLRDDYERNL